MLERSVRIAMWRKLSWVPAVQRKDYRWVWYYACAMSKLKGQAQYGLWWWL